MTTSTLRVLTYHRVVGPDAADAPSPSLVSATPAVFAEQMRHLARRYRVIPADEVVWAYRAGRRLPDRAVLITFDDAYRDVGEIAWPILRRFGLPATVFVPTAHPDGGRTFWWDRLHHALGATSCVVLDVVPLGRLPLHTPEARRAALRVLQGHLKSLPHADAMRLVDELCDRLGLAAAQPPSNVHGWDELRQLARDGMTIGAHTRTHPALTRLPLHEARAEIGGSREDVRREVGTVPVIFAYPFGAHDDRVVEAARAEGFDLAVTCLDGHARIPACDPLRLCRTNITPRTSSVVFRLRLSSLGPHVDRLRHRRPAPA